MADEGNGIMRGAQRPPRETVRGVVEWWLPELILAGVAPVGAAVLWVDGFPLWSVALLVVSGLAVGRVVLGQLRIGAENARVLREHAEYKARRAAEAAEAEQEPEVRQAHARRIHEPEPRSARGELE